MADRLKPALRRLFQARCTGVLVLAFGTNRSKLATPGGFRFPGFSPHQFSPYDLPVSRSAVIVRTLVILTLVWTAVWGIRAIAGSFKITAESVSREVAKADFADWSVLPAPPGPAEARQREQQLRDLAAMINRLDFVEHASHRRNHTDELLFRKLSPPEQELFVELTVMKSINSFLDSLEAIPAKQRKRFIEQGFKAVAEDSDGKPGRIANPLVGPLLDKLDVKGIRAFVNSSSAATKFSLAPLVEAINESIQGLRGNDFGPPHRD